MAGENPDKSMFTLAHLSDPHLAPLPRPHASELLNKRITGYLNWLRNRRFIHIRAVLDKITADLSGKAEHIAVTGDITNIAAQGEFVQGRAWLESLGSPENVTFIPGNHDSYVREGLALTARYFSPYMRGDDGETGFPFVRRRGPLALIGLTSGLPTTWGMATGRLGAGQLARLVATLDALQEERLFRVVLVHHPAVSKAKWYKRLLDAADFLRVIAGHGAELVLHGHDHLHMLNWLPGPNGTRVPAVGVPSTSTAPGTGKNAAAYNLYAIDGAPGAWSCELVARCIGQAGEIVEQKRIALLPQ
jgi:3',5'-cyclic AMP phosphodiesterase CpdA